MSKEFKRTDHMRFLRLGKNKSRVKWRRADGVHSKIRRKRAGYPIMPSIGFGTPKTESGKVQGLNPVLVHNVKEISALDKNSIAVIARVGAKNKMAMLKKAEEMKIKVANAGGKK